MMCVTEMTSNRYTDNESEKWTLSDLVNGCVIFLGIVVLLTVAELCKCFIQVSLILLI